MNTYQFLFWHEATLRPRPFILHIAGSLALSTPPTSLHSATQFVDKILHRQPLMTPLRISNPASRHRARSAPSGWTVPLARPHPTHTPSPGSLAHHSIMKADPHQLQVRNERSPPAAAGRQAPRPTRGTTSVDPHRSCTCRQGKSKRSCIPPRLRGLPGRLTSGGPRSRPRRAR